MARIETIYRARIYFDVQGSADDVQTIEEICDRALKFGTRLENCEANPGGPCWGPSVFAEDESLAAVQAWAGKVERYIARRKGAKVEP